MRASVWQRAKSIFDEARRLPLAERTTLVERSCGGDKELRTQVEVLLGAYDSDFLEESVLGTADALNSPVLVYGQVIGKYRTHELIGSGGMGQVFRAEDTELSRPVAFKVLHKDVAEDQERVRRFIQEARAASALNHPNILTIHEIGSFEGLRYIVSEFVDGETLRERMQRGLSAAESIEITCQIAAALEAAHSAGIVHRDIKPENVMFRKDGLVKVLDFGLAKLTEADDGPLDPNAPVSRIHTSPGLVMGTLAYMSPEQALGQSVDARSDLWSLGVVLHEMLTGKSPFEGETVTELITAIAKTKGAPLHLDKVPGELRPICSKALSKDKESRYRSAHDLLQDLKGEKKKMEYAIEATPYVSLPGRTDELETQLIRRRPTLSAEYIVTSVKRHKYATLIGIALVLSSAIGLSVYKFKGATPPLSASSLAVFNADTTEKDLGIARLPVSGKVFEVAISPDGKFAAYTTGPTRARTSLHVIERATNRDLELVPEPPAGKTAWLYDLAFTPDAQRVSYYYASGANKDIWSVSTSGGTPEKNTFTAGAFSYSPDGSQIVFSKPTLDETSKNMTSIDLVISDIDGSRPRVLIHNVVGEQKPIYWCGGVPAWSNDGKWIACWDWRAMNPTSGNNIVAISTVDGSRQSYSEQKWEDISGVVWTPDGNIIVAGKEYGTEPRTPSQLWLVSKTGAKRITNDPAGYERLSGTRDGSILLTTQPISRRDLWVMTGADAGTARPITSSGEIGGGFAPLPDGGVLIVSRINESQSFWRVNLDGYGRKQLRSGEAGVVNIDPHATRDGRYILFSSYRRSEGLRAYHVFRINADGSDLKQLTEKVGRLIDVSEDSKWVFYDYVEGGDRFVAKVPINGGPSTVVAKVYPHGVLFAISPRDGRIAQMYEDPVGTPAGMRIYSSTGKELKKIPIPTMLHDLLPHWTPDGKGIAYVDGRDHQSNIWVVSPDGKRPPKPLTNFSSPQTNGFDFTLDGKQMIVTRVNSTSDAIMITNKGH